MASRALKTEDDPQSSFQVAGNDVDDNGKRKRSSMDDDEEEEEEDLSELEKNRRRNIAEKNKMFQQLGIREAVQELHDMAESVKTEILEIRRKRKEEQERFGNNRVPLQPTRTSTRIAHQPVVNYDEESLLNQSALRQRYIEKEVEETERDFISDPEPMKQMRSGEDKQNVKTSLTELLPYLQRTGGTKATTDVSLDSYKKVLQNLKLAPEKTKKVGIYKLYSLTVHPSESKTLVITGGDRGTVGFWDASRSDDSAVEIFSPLDAPVYCVSVCTHNPSLVYCTDLDGITRRCDLEKLQFLDVHVNSGRNHHTPYHSQLSPYVLMIACGDGTVKVVDVREGGRPSHVFKCHEKSVRTVQRHPSMDHIFVTASRTCSVAIWDMRRAQKQKPLAELPHPKALKSAFFSPGGGLLLTSCNDNRLRVYETGYMEGPLKVVMNTEHNLFTGRFIRPFKATWHPLRDDVFIIGSLDLPRKVDIYGIHGFRIHSLQSPNLTTILTNCMFHPSLDMVVGHNSSGRVHVFE